MNALAEPIFHARLGGIVLLRKSVRRLGAEGYICGMLSVISLERQRAPCYAAPMNVEVRDEQLQGLKVTPDRLRLEMAAGLYASEEVTLGQAAAIAGLTQTRFLQELGRRGICIHYGVEEFEQDLRTLKTLRRE